MKCSKIGREGGELRGNFIFTDRQMDLPAARWGRRSSLGKGCSQMALRPRSSSSF